jgi:hypothetical protein
MGNGRLMEGRQRGSLGVGKERLCLRYRTQGRRSQEPEAQRLAGARLVIYRHRHAARICMGLAHKISNHGLRTFRAGQAVHAGASEWKVAQSKGRQTCAPVGEREGWSSGRERRSAVGAGQVLGRWDVQVLFVFGIGTSSRAGDGQPCPGRGQCWAGCGCGWKLEFGVCGGRRARSKR